MTDKHGESAYVEGSHGTRKEKNKRFLDQNEVLSLAALIADEQEHKSQTKTDKIKADADRRHHTPSKSKSRLEERKAALAVQLAQAKRDHARSRKQRHSKTISKHGDQSGKQARKSVSFSS